MKKYIPRVLTCALLLGCTIYQNFITTFSIGIIVLVIGGCFFRGSAPYLLLTILIIRLAIFQHGVTSDYAFLGCRHSGQEIDIALDGTIQPITSSKYSISGTFGSLLINTYLSPEQLSFIHSQKMISMVAKIQCLGPGPLLPYSYDAHLFSLGVRGVVTKIYSLAPHTATAPTKISNSPTILKSNYSFKHGDESKSQQKLSGVEYFGSPALSTGNLSSTSTPQASQSLPNNITSILAGILWGDTSGLSKDMYRDFIDSGLVHLISASGGNILMVLLLSSYILIFVPIRYRKYIQLIIVLLYACGVGENISFIRALLAYVCARILIPSGYRPHKSHIITTSVLLLYIYNPPLLLASRGLLLSVAGVFGLMFMPKLSPHQHKPILSQLVSSFFAMFTLTGPLLLLTGKINVLSPLLTILASPLINGIFFSYVLYMISGYDRALIYLVSMIEKLAHRGATSGLFVVVSLSANTIYCVRIGTRILLVIIYYRARKHYFAYDIRD